jgi:hypothetical protein
MPEQRILKVADAARELDCSEETVLARAEELGGVKFGRAPVFPAETFYARVNALAAAGSVRRRDKPAPSAVVQPLRKRAPPALPGA